MQRNGYGREQAPPTNAFGTQPPLKGHCKNLGVQIDTKPNIEDHFSFTMNEFP